LEKKYTFKLNVHVKDISRKIGAIHKRFITTNLEERNRMGTQIQVCGPVTGFTVLMGLINAFTN